MPRMPPRPAAPSSLYPPPLSEDAVVCVGGPSSLVFDVVHAGWPSSNLDISSYQPLLEHMCQWFTNYHFPVELAMKVIVGVGQDKAY